MKIKSIRWRLSLSYAGIALLAAILLGAIMLTILQQYYADQELEYLEQNAAAIGKKMAALQSSEESTEVLDQMLAAFAFFSNTQVRLLDPAGDVLLDTGLPQGQTALAYKAFPDPDALIGFDAGFTIVSTEVFTTEKEFTQVIPDSFTLDEVIILEEGSGNFPGWVIGAPASDNKVELPSTELTARSRYHIQHPYYNQQGEMQGVIELFNGPAYGRDILSSIVWGWAIAALAAVLLAAAAGVWVSRRFSAPLESLTQTTTKMASGNLSARSDIERQDEFGLLANSFNTMAQTIEAKVAALRRFVADAAHELGTPLTALHTNLELVDDPQITTALKQVERMDALTRNLLDLSHLEAAESDTYFEDIDLAGMLHDLAEPFASRAEQAEISFKLDTGTDPVTIQGDAAQLSTLIQNLLDNAIKFTPTGGQVSVNLSQQADAVLLSVTDTGIGIPEDDLPNLFSRFHRGSNAAAHPGSGLGLAIVKAIADQHGAKIRVESDTNGTQVLVQFVPLSLEY